MNGTAMEAHGIVRLLNNNSNVFGYIETPGGKEIYFDSSSLCMPECSELGDGDTVSFMIVRNEYGEIARQITLIRKKELPKRRRRSKMGNKNRMNPEER